MSRSTTSFGSQAVNQATADVVLGIDAAWTTHQPSGVALVQRKGSHWQCKALAPSYDSFLAFASGQPQNPATKARGSEPDPGVLLQASQQLTGQPVSCVSVDMPLATTPITGRRAADNIVSSRFGKRGCAVHSPSAERPGAIADRLRGNLASLGCSLHTTSCNQGLPALIEVYPHVALLALLGRDYRVPYKVSRSLQYWKSEQLSPAERITRLLQEFQAIRAGLEPHIAAIPTIIPEVGEVKTLASLKPIEDMLDALVCAWMGIQHLQGRSSGLGDSGAAIWVPTSLLR